MLGEGREIDDAHVPAQIHGFAADVLEIIRAAETPFVLGLDAGRREPVGTLPAVALAEHRTHALELVVDRTGLGRPRIRPLLVGEMNHEDVAVGLLVLLNDVALARVGTVAARIDRHHVDARLALADPLAPLPAW